MPFFINAKKGFEVTKNMVEGPKKGVDVKSAKRQVTGYKAEYQVYKRRGGTKGYTSWAADNGVIQERFDLLHSISLRDHESRGTLERCHPQISH